MVIFHHATEGSKMSKVQTKSKEAKMIYAQQSVARMIAGKMTISKQVQHVVHKVATGFQVVRHSGTCVLA